MPFENMNSCNFETKAIYLPDIKTIPYSVHSVPVANVIHLPSPAVEKLTFQCFKITSNFPEMHTSSIPNGRHATDYRFGRDQMSYKQSSFCNSLHFFFFFFSADKGFDNCILNPTDFILKVLMCSFL